MNVASSLRTHRLLMRLAFSAANAFVWIFVFQYFLSFNSAHMALARTALLYVLAYLVSFLVTPYAARRLRHGMKRGIVYGALAACAAFVSLGISFQGFFGYQYLYYGVLAFAIFLGVYRALYWVPYSVESHATHTRTRMSSFVEICVALMPAVAGIALTGQWFAPPVLLFLAGLCVALSLIPLARVSDVYEKFSWKYRETFAQLFASAHRAQLGRAFFDGIQSAVLFFLWPIAIFLLVGSSYMLVGLLLSTTFLLAFALRDSIRGLIRALGIRDVSLLYATVAFSAWVGRVFVATPFSIVLVDTYFHTGTAGREGMDMTTLEQLADGGSFVDERTALKEMGLAIGRITVCIIAAGVSVASSISLAFLVSFLIAGIAAAFSMWIAHTAMIRKV